MLGDAAAPYVKYYELSPSWCKEQCERGVGAAALNVVGNHCCLSKAAAKTNLNLG